MNTPKHPCNQDLHEIIQELMRAGHSLNPADCPPPPNRPCCNHAHCPDEQDNDCVVLQYSDFVQLMSDMAELGDMVDTLLQMHAASDHRIRELVGVARKLDAVPASRHEKQYIQCRTNQIMEKWSDADLIAVCE